MNDAAQTGEFFAASWAQYEGVEAIDKTIAVIIEAAGAIWADVTWSNGDAHERFCYQLVERPQGWQITVLTPPDRPAAGNPVAFLEQSEVRSAQDAKADPSLSCGRCSQQRHIDTRCHAQCVSRLQPIRGDQVPLFRSMESRLRYLFGASADRRH